MNLLVGFVNHVICHLQFSSMCSAKLEVQINTFDRDYATCKWRTEEISKNGHIWNAVGKMLISFIYHMDVQREWVAGRRKKPMEIP